MKLTLTTEANEDVIVEPLPEGRIRLIFNETAIYLGPDEATALSDLLTTAVGIAGDEGDEDE